MADIIADMGEFCIGYENDILISIGLGSCVGVVLHDPINKIAGLAHIMLPTSAESKIIFPKKEVMIADMDSLVRENIKNILHEHNFSVVSEVTAKEQAFNEYKKHRHAVSFVSAFLPPTNGLDAIHEMLSYNSRASAVVICPKVEKHEADNYIKNGAAEVIQKPYTEENVINSANFCLYRKFLKYADKALEIMIGKLVNRGAHKKNLTAKFAGGAHMFETIVSDDNSMNIGKRNTLSVEKILDEMNIKVLSHESGGHIGRTIGFDVNSGKLKIKTKDGAKEI